MNKIEMHKEICDTLNRVYADKNSDYGDSFAILRKEHPNAILVRLGDKYNKLKTLMGGTEQKILDESIKDTLLDLANYCIMEVVEMDSTFNLRTFGKNDKDIEEPKDECDHDCSNCKNKSSFQGSFEVEKETLNPLVEFAKISAETQILLKIADEIARFVFKPATEELFDDMHFIVHNIIQEYNETTNTCTKITVDSSFKDKKFIVYGEYGEITLKGGKLC